MVRGKGQVGERGCFFNNGKVARVFMPQGRGRCTGEANHKREGVGSGAQVVAQGGGGDSALARSPARCETGGRQGQGRQTRGSRSNREVTQRRGGSQTWRDFQTSK